VLHALGRAVGPDPYLCPQVLELHNRAVCEAIVRQFGAIFQDLPRLLARCSREGQTLPWGGVLGLLGMELLLQDCNSVL